MKSTAESLILWEQRIKERIQSKLTVDDWCKRNGINKHQYNYWNRRVRKKQSTTEEIPFADITPILSNNNPGSKDCGGTSDFQIIFDDIRVIVPSNFHPKALAELMKVLRTA